MIGRVIKGKYKIYDEVGAGGFATVYLGRNMDSNEIVAIKILGDQFTREPRYLERFRREASLAERLQHPNIVRVFDHGVENGVHFLVMEFVEGPTLDRIIERQGRLPIQQVLSYVEQACAGLQAAYRAGIVHRDIKPANVMITPDGTVKIMDFGIARVESLSGLTQSGVFVGTPRYISPEMAAGTGADIRSDLYALGLLTYEMLTGEPPFDADNPWAVLRQQIEVQPRPLREIRPEVPQWLENVVMRAIVKDPDNRFQTPAEMLAALRERTDTPQPFSEAAAPTRRREERAAEAPTRERQGSRGLIIGLLAAVAVLTVALVALVVFGLGGGEATPTVPARTSTAVVMVITNTPEPTQPPTSTQRPTSTQPPPTSAPTDTPLPTSTATQSPTRTPEPMATETPAPTDSPQPTATPTEAPTDTPRPTTAATKTASPTDTPTSPPAPAASGRITFSAQGTLHIVDAATGRDTVGPLSGMSQPDFRPDGGLIIAKGIGSGKTSLWTINANTGAFIREQSGFTDDYRPFWAPDGVRFVYDSLHLGEGVFNLYINGVDTRVDNIVSYSGMNVIGTSPVWMQDDFLAFTGCDYWPGGAGGANCGIYRIPSWGGPPSILQRGNLTMRATDNHGSDLLYMSQESGDWEVYVMPNRGGAGRNLSTSPGSHDGLGTFSPDGKLVAFASNRGGGWAVWMVRLNGTGTTKLFDLPAPLTGDWTEEHISWGP